MEDIYECRAVSFQFVDFYCRGLAVGSDSLCDLPCTLNDARSFSLLFLFLLNFLFHLSEDLFLLRDLPVQHYKHMLVRLRHATVPDGLVAERVVYADLGGESRV